MSFLPGLAKLKRCWGALLMISIFFTQHHHKNSAGQSIAMLKKTPYSLIILCSVIVSFSLAREASEIWIYFSSFQFQSQAFYFASIGAAIGVGIGMSLGGIIYYLLVFMREKYFIPGFLLVVTLLAGGLSMQVAKQLMQIGLLDSSGPLWDSSFLINEQSWMGELLYALFGYDAQPTATQGFFYLAATLPMVIGFLWHWQFAGVNNHAQKN